MSLWERIKSWFKRAEDEVKKLEPTLVSDAEAAYKLIKPELDALKAHVDALFTVLRAEFQKVSQAAPAVEAAPSAQPPVAQDLVAAKQAELDKQLATITEQKAAIASALDRLTKALSGGQ